MSWPQERIAILSAHSYGCSKDTVHRFSRAGSLTPFSALELEILSIETEPSLVVRTPVAMSGSARILFGLFHG